MQQRLGMEVMPDEEDGAFIDWNEMCGVWAEQVIAQSEALWESVITFNKLYIDTSLPFGRYLWVSADKHFQERRTSRAGMELNAMRVHNMSIQTVEGFDQYNNLILR
jgi:hypothetical protein